MTAATMVSLFVLACFFSAVSICAGTTSDDIGAYFIVIDQETGHGYTIDEFLDLTAEHFDWAEGGWDINSRMTRVAKEIFWQVNGAEPCGLEDPKLLVSSLERGVKNILSHYNPKDGLVGDSGSDLVHRLGGTLKGTNIYWVMGMEHPYLKQLSDSLIRHEENGDWRAEADGRETVPRNVAELVSLCLETTNYRREELFRVLESVAEWSYRDFGIHHYTIQYALGFIGTMLHWNNTRFGHPLWTRTRGLSYPYVLTTEVGNWPKGSTKVRLIENPDFLGAEESDWYDHRQTRVRMSRKEEPQPAPFWAEGPIELGVDPEDGIDVPGEMGENTYRFRDMEPWEEGAKKGASIGYALLTLILVVAIGSILGLRMIRHPQNSGKDGSSP